MPLTVREILALPEVAHALPVATAGTDGLDRQVGWAHSSEIYEIAPLLRGGEFLLTTGLGLAGVDAGARRQWMRDLVDRGVAAIGFEVGRSLPEIPDELVDEAAKHGMPLIRLDRVVPFERICREVNTVLLDREGTEIRLAERLTEALFTALGTGGLTAITSVAAAELGTSVAVCTVAGRVVAAGGPATERELTRIVATAELRADVEVAGSLWGEVVVADEFTWPDGAAAVAARRVAAAAAVAVSQAGAASGLSDSLVTALLTDLLADGIGSEREVLVRAGLAGFHPPPAADLLGVAALASEPMAVITALRGVADGVLVGRVRGRLAAVAAVRTAPADPAGATVSALRESLAGRTDVSCVVGPAVTLAEAGRSLREAWTAVEAVPAGVHTWRALVPAQLLRQVPAGRVDDLVTDLLGPLIRWDRAHGSDLVHTVDVYLRHGCSPTRAAAALHVRRQSLHQRLARVESLLGRPAGEPEGLTAMLLALDAVGHGFGAHPAHGSGLRPR